MKTLTHCIFIRLVFLVLIVAITPTSNARELVLIGANIPEHQSFTSFEVRKLFLGHPIKKNNKIFKAIINTSDDMAYQVFLQKIIHLSEKNYERKLLSQKFRTGSLNVLSEPTLLKLNKALNKDKSRLSFSWLDEISQKNSIKVIQTLWKGDIHD